MSREDFYASPLGHVGDFGPLGTQPEIESWLADAGFDLTSAKRSGPFLFFEAHKRT